MIALLSSPPLTPFPCLPYLAFSCSLDVLLDPLPLPLSTSSPCALSPDSSLLASPECGHHYYRRVVHPEHLPPPSTQVPELTKRSSSDVGTPAQRYLPPNLLPSTQQPTLPAGRLSLDKNLTHANETSTSSVGDSLEAGENQKQKKENMGPTAEISVIVPVLSLLAIVFILTGVLLYVLCKRRMQSLQYPPGKLVLESLPQGTRASLVGILTSVVSRWLETYPRQTNMKATCTMDHRS